MEADIAANALDLGTNTDFSLLSLFLKADIIVKAVMISLILCSVYSWAVIIEKYRLFKKINKSSEEFEEKFWNSKSAENFYNGLPFIGLFGTVWGIMNSFQSIAISRNTSLAIVAPGIAEALFATALGLLAAIPAVVAYNKFNTDAKKYSEKLENFSKRFLTII